MQIKQLEYFIAVCEHLNFTRAAEQFYISQSAVTLQIKALEEELGVRLFHRTNRKVELTPAGKTFLEDARAIIRRTRDAVDRARQSDTILTGSLNIGYIKGYEKSNLSDLLSDFRGKYSNISIGLTRENVAPLYDRLADGSLDIVFNLLYRMEDLDFMEYRVLKRYPLYAVLPISHPLAHRTSIKRQELKGYPLVDIKKGENKYGEKATITEAFINAGFLPHVQYVSEDIETSILAVSAGLGYALLPSYITDTLSARDKVVCVSLEGEERRMTLVAGWHRENKNPALRCFLEEYILK
ncbi:MAG: LysR family transcriptional regulator [Oscillospiraceae bacterium]|nr:LysR family transcriptional regulator [Oscillospiraceae bacterium]